MKNMIDWLNWIKNVFFLILFIVYTKVVDPSQKFKKKLNLIDCTRTYNKKKYLFCKYKTQNYSQWNVNIKKLIVK